MESHSTQKDVSRKKVEIVVEIINCNFVSRFHLCILHFVIFAVGYFYSK